MREAVFATGIPFAGVPRKAEFSAILHKIMPQVAGVRRFGAAALDLAWVAAGRYEGFWESGLQPWDAAAGCLLVREAGGFVSDFKGRSHPICDAEVLAGNDALRTVKALQAQDATPFAVYEEGVANTRNSSRSR